jgi:hypothetical protein
MARLSAPQMVSVILILAIGASGVALIANIGVHTLDPSQPIIKPSQLSAISLFEILGIGFSFALNKGKPPLGLLFGRKKMESGRQRDK